MRFLIATRSNNWRLFQRNTFWIHRDNWWICARITTIPSILYCSRFNIFKYNLNPYINHIHCDHNNDAVPVLTQWRYCHNGSILNCPQKLPLYSWFTHYWTPTLIYENGPLPGYPIPLGILPPQQSQSLPYLLGCAFHDHIFRSPILPQTRQHQARCGWSVCIRLGRQVRNPSLHCSIAIDSIHILLHCDRCLTLHNCTHHPTDRDHSQLRHSMHQHTGGAQ